MMRKIILNLAMSLDGYISDPDGGFDWIVGHGDQAPDEQGGFDFPAFLESIDTVVMGSKAYEDCILSGLSDMGDRKIIVATSRTFEPREHVEFVNGDICGHVLKLKENQGKDIWLFGGAGLTDAFIKEDKVDEYIVAVIPTILGSGRSLFKGGSPKIDLHLDTHGVSDGIVVMTYSKRA